MNGQYDLWLTTDRRMEREMADWDAYAERFDTPESRQKLAKLMADSCLHVHSPRAAALVDHIHAWVEKHDTADIEPVAANYDLWPLFEIWRGQFDD